MFPTKSATCRGNNKKPRSTHPASRNVFYEEKRTLYIAPLRSDHPSFTSFHMCLHSSLTSSLGPTCPASPSRTILESIFFSRGPPYQIYYINLRRSHDCFCLYVRVRVRACACVRDVVNTYNLNIEENELGSDSRQVPNIFMN